MVRINSRGNEASAKYGIRRNLTHNVTRRATHIAEGLAGRHPALEVGALDAQRPKVATCWHQRSSSPSPVIFFPIFAHLCK